MNDRELFAKLASAARWDSPPDVNVTFQVIRRVAAVRPRAVDPILGYFTVAACAAAGVVIILAVQSWLRMQDPLLALANTINTVM